MDPSNVCFKPSVTWSSSWPWESVVRVTRDSPECQLNRGLYWTQLTNERGGQGTDNLDSEHNTTCNGATEQSRWSRSQVLGNKGTFIRLCIYWLVGPDHETMLMQHRVHYVECVAWLVSVRSYHQAHSAPTMKTATINHRIEHPDTVCINWPYFIYLVLQWFLHVFLSVYWFYWIW